MTSHVQSIVRQDEHNWTKNGVNQSLQFARFLQAASILHRSTKWLVKYGCTATLHNTILDQDSVRQTLGTWSSWWAAGSEGQPAGGFQASPGLLGVLSPLGHDRYYMLPPSSLYFFLIFFLPFLQTKRVLSRFNLYQFELWTAFVTIKRHFNWIKLQCIFFITWLTHETMWHQRYKVVPREDKTHSSGVILSYHDISVPNKSWNPLLPSYAECSRQNKKVSV